MATRRRSGSAFYCYCPVCIAGGGRTGISVKKSANGRYLVDQNNTPFLITGDSPQALIVNLSTNDAQMFFTDRATNGFNTVWINLLCNWYTGGRADGSTFDGISRLQHS